MGEAFSRLPGLLLPWYDGGHRNLPWRRDREPYHVWLSEIMLQQTRVEAVKDYYARVLAELPDIQALAGASDDRCRKLWEGLGYYTRVRNLRLGAQQIVERHGGVFPQDYDDVRALAGIGDYTAGAICSICFEQPTPAVDGNVLRVATRLTEDARPVSDAKYKRELTKALAAVYPATRRGDFTQALMELGAVVCAPNGAPKCESCPLSRICAAYKHGTQVDFPVRAAKKPRRKEKLTVFLLRCGDRVAVRKRGETGLLAGLWEYPNVPGHLDMDAALRQAEAWETHPSAPQTVTEKTHVFTHVEWEMRCYAISCAAQPPLFRWATEEELRGELALPTAFRILS